MRQENLGFSEIGVRRLHRLDDAGKARPVSRWRSGNDEAANRFKEGTGIPVYKWDVSDFQACQDGIARVEAVSRRRRAPTARR